MPRGFLHCEACDEVGREAAAPCTPGLVGPDRLPDDFEPRHAGHPVRHLRAAPDGFVTEARYGSQVPVAFHQVEDAAGVRSLVEVRRRAVGETPVYRLHRGGLVRTRQAIRVDRDAIARAVAGALGRPVDAPVADAAGRLAAAVAAAAQAVGFDALEAAAVAGPTPLVSYAPLPKAALAAVADAARRVLGELGGAADPSRRMVARLLEPEALPGGAFGLVLESGFAVVHASGAVEAYVRRIRTRDPRPAVRQSG